MALEKQHDILDLLLLGPALLDPLHPEFPDTRHIKQKIRLMLDHFQRPVSEGVYDLFGKFRTDPLDHAAAQIFFHTVSRGGQSFLKSLHRKLPAIFRVHLPASAQGKHTSHVDLRHGTNHSDKIRIALGPAF